MQTRRRVIRKRELVHANPKAGQEMGSPVMLSAALISIWGPNDNFVRKQRPNVSLNLITSGNATFEQDGRHGQVSRGTIFIAQKGSSQILQTGPDMFMNKRTIILEGPALDTIMMAFRLTGHDTVSPHDIPHTINLFRRAYRILSQKKTGFTSEASRILWDILLACSESLTKSYPDQLRRGMDFIHANLHRPPSLEAIAKACGLSPRHCTRLFSQHTGHSPVQFCIQQRMNMAENLVINTTQPFKQIASSLGYEDALHFSVQFKHHFKVSPRHYRLGKA